MYKRQAYTGARPVSKGWNTRRRHAEPGRHETVIVDDRWRAICFASGPPQGLASGMLGPLDRLRAICGERALMIGFDRGGAYPKAFSELRGSTVAAAKGARRYVTQSIPRSRSTVNAFG